MRFLCPLGLLLTSTLTRALIPTPLSYYVSINSGNDAAPNDGTLALPFKTIGRVQLAIQVRKAADLAANAVTPPINVYLRAGRYELDSTLEFTPLDSGADINTSITYQAYCDATLEKSKISILPYPYHSKLTTPPRLLWNGVGDNATWLGGSFTGQN